MSKPKIFVIVGPTSSGKTDLSIKLAQKINGEIISADSRQVYKGLDIGTGKVTKKEMSDIPHYLIDVANPKRKFTVSQFQKLANKKIKTIIKKGKTPIIVGGTGFYIQTIVDNLNLPAVPPDKKLRKNLEKKTTTELFSLLKKLDSKRARNIDPNNPVRLIRAIEIAQTLGKIPKLKKAKKSPYDFIQIGIKTDQEKLNKKIYQRLLKRLRQGMIDEAKKLHKEGLSWNRMKELGLEYRFLALYLQDKITKKEMIEKIYQENIKYSKRQETWFKRDKRIIWLTPKNFLSKIELFI